MGFVCTACPLFVALFFLSFVLSLSVCLRVLSALVCGVHKTTDLCFGLMDNPLVISQWNICTNRFDSSPLFFTLSFLSSAALCVHRVDVTFFGFVCCVIVYYMIRDGNVLNSHLNRICPNIWQKHLVMDCCYQRINQKSNENKRVTLFLAVSIQPLIEINATKMYIRIGCSAALFSDWWEFIQLAIPKAHNPSER